MSAQAPAALLADLQKDHHTDLKSTPSAGDASLAQAKLLKSLEKDHSSGLKHVASPDAKESTSVTQAKVLLAVSSKHELKSVDTKGEGLTDAEKAAFLEVQAKKKAGEKIEE